VILYGTSNIENLPTLLCGFLFFYARICGSFFYQKQLGVNMQLEIINNPDESQIVLYKTARVIYAETYPTTLPATEAVASMIHNIMTKTKRDLSDIISDETIFDSLNENSPRHKYIDVDIKNNRAFQMCLRVVERMVRGGVCDTCFGATRFHRANEMPDWATSRGYIADIDGLLFYL
jgi:hypothetical protein